MEVQNEQELYSKIMVLRYTYIPFHQTWKPLLLVFQSSLISKCPGMSSSELICKNGPQSTTLCSAHTSYSLHLDIALLSCLLIIYKYFNMCFMYTFIPGSCKVRLNALCWETFFSYEILEFLKSVEILGIFNIWKILSSKLDKSNSSIQAYPLIWSVQI